MPYLAQLNHHLRPQPSTAYRVLDLFAGCGGLSLGFEAAGFHSVGYEMDERAAETYNKNLKGPCHAQKLSIETEYDGVFNVVIGGPPCQPFSVGGHQKGVSDERNGFHILMIQRQGHYCCENKDAGFFAKSRILVQFHSSA